MSDGEKRDRVRERRERESEGARQRREGAAEIRWSSPFKMSSLGERGKKEERRRSGGGGDSRFH